MESLMTKFLLFLAAITGLITYLIVPQLPVAAIMVGAAAALVGGIWWHWSQFAVEYRTSTWQEQLRNYASYVMLVVVILLSYLFYSFMTNDGPARAQAAIRSSGRKATETMSRSLSGMSNTLFSSPTPSPSPAASSRSLNLNRNFGLGLGGGGAGAGAGGGTMMALE